MATESAKPRPNGISVVFPAVPILSAISIVLCLPILPGFWKTRIFAVVYYLCWLIVGNGLLLVNTCIWQGNVRNIPIYSDFVAIFWSGYSRALSMCILCVSKFIWTISKPAPLVRVYDERRRTNIIDACLCVGIPLLLLAFSAAFLFTGRYILVEDLGPWPVFPMSIFSFSIDTLPIVLGSIGSTGFSCLSCYNFWRSRLEQPSPGCSITCQSQHRSLSTSQYWRHMLMCLSIIIGSIYGAVWITLPYISHILEHPHPNTWYRTFGITSNKLAYRQIYIWAREAWEPDGHVLKRNLIGFAYTLPFIGIQLSMFFGFGYEVRKTYIGWFQAFIQSKFSMRVSSWSKGLVAIAIRARTQLGTLVSWPRGRGQVESNVFTPFQAEDIVLEDLSFPWHSTRISRQSPAFTPLASSSLKRLHTPISLWTERRKDPLPARVRQEEVHGDAQQQQQPGVSFKVKQLQVRSPYGVNRKGLQ
ncbi:a-factor receptor [Serendipita sp. 401]|nr:a-factor receptor [Serendipita sp. 401]KAG8837551.1 a-factor receptor [Serendipita sp. 400]KAG9052825.1 a-factor receptor [Serendipita sp. 407]